MLDQERCILCSRCVRFTDEITKTGEFGIFNRGDQAELGTLSWQLLDNPYSANVVDICPVGALTERDFRFKVRVWYLSSAPTICNGCSQGCNIDLHYVLDRPHLNDGARVVRIKPRYNPDVNQWWICDEGRYGFGWVDRAATGRRYAGRQPMCDADATWEQALTAISNSSGRVGRQDEGARIGVIASAQLTNEELFLIREIFQALWAPRSAPRFREQPGSSDDFLIKADKNPNTSGQLCSAWPARMHPMPRRSWTKRSAGILTSCGSSGTTWWNSSGEEKVRKIPEKVRSLRLLGHEREPRPCHWPIGSCQVQPMWRRTGPS